MLLGLKRFPKGSASQLLNAHNEVKNLANEVAKFFVEADIRLTPVTPAAGVNLRREIFIRFKVLIFQIKGPRTFLFGLMHAGIRQFQYLRV